MKTFFNEFPFQQWRILLPAVLLCFIIIPVSAAIDVSVTGDIQDWTLQSGSTVTDANTIKLGVTSDTLPWTVSVIDSLPVDADKNPKDRSSAGKMLEYNLTNSRWINTTGKVLSSNLTVTGEKLLPFVTNGYSVPLGPTGRDIETGVATSGAKVMNISVSQQVSYLDQRLMNGNKYRVVITFVGTEIGG